MAGVAETLEIVSDDLFVEAVLIAAGLVFIGGPESGGVGGEHFVDEDGIGGFIVGRIQRQTPFEFGIGEEDVALGGVVACVGVDGDGEVAEFGHEFGAGDLAGLLEADVFIVACFGFGGGGEDGGGEFFALFQTGGEFDSAYGLGLLIFFPAGAGEVTADDAFDGNDAGFFADHDAALEGGALIGGQAGDVVGVGGEKVMFDAGGETVEPEA